MIDEGYIKFNCIWEKSMNPSELSIDDLMQCRDRMHQLKLIGYYPNLAVGYGNISQRIKKSSNFIISATQTGNIYPINKQHFTIVTAYNLQLNKLWCKGPSKASSESLTHAAIYESDKRIRAVIHIHNKEIWKETLNKIPTSKSDVPYGTPEMALEIKRLFVEEELAKKKVMVMAGHEEGLIAFGLNLKEAEENILKLIS